MSICKHGRVSAEITKQIIRIRRGDLFQGRGRRQEGLKPGATHSILGRRRDVNLRKFAESIRVVLPPVVKGAIRAGDSERPSNLGRIMKERNIGLKTAEVSLRELLQRSGPLGDILNKKPLWSPDYLRETPFEPQKEMGEYIYFFPLVLFFRTFGAVFDQMAVYRSLASSDGRKALFYGLNKNERRFIYERANDMERRGLFNIAQKELLDLLDNEERRALLGALDDEQRTKWLMDALSFRYGHPNSPSPARSLFRLMNDAQRLTSFKMLHICDKLVLFRAMGRDGMRDMFRACPGELLETLPPPDLHRLFTAVDVHGRGKLFMALGGTARRGFFKSLDNAEKRSLETMAKSDGRLALALLIANGRRKPIRHLRLITT